MKIPWTRVLVGTLLTTTMITTSPSPRAQTAGAVWIPRSFPKPEAKAKHHHEAHV